MPGPLHVLMVEQCQAMHPGCFCLSISDGVKLKPGVKSTGKFLYSAVSSPHDCS